MCQRYDGIKHDLYLKSQPYVHPYVDKTAQFYENNGKHTIQYVQKTYRKYGRPSVRSAQRSAVSHYERFISPQIRKIRNSIVLSYNTSLGPTVSGWQKKYQRDYKPLVVGSQKSATKVYNQAIVPMSQKIGPKFAALDLRLRTFRDTFIFPQLKLLGRKILEILTNGMLPRLQVVWGKHIAPQINKINDRLSDYKRHKQVDHAIKDAKSSTKTISSSISSSVSSMLTSMCAAPNMASQSKVVAKAEQSASSSELEADLKVWRKTLRKSSGAAAETLDHEITEYVLRSKYQFSSVASGLLQELRNVIEFEVHHGETNAIHLARTDTPSVEDFLSVVRISGANIRDKAFEIRKYMENVRNDTMDHVRALQKSSLDNLDDIKISATRELSKKWGDAIVQGRNSPVSRLETYTKELKENMPLQNIGKSSIAEFVQRVEEVDTQAAQVASSGADRLASLRKVGKRKIEMHDDSVDFGDAYMPAAFLKILDGIKTAAGLTTEPSQPAAKSLLSRLSVAASSAYKEGLSTIGTGAQEGFTQATAAAGSVLNEAGSYTSSIAAVVSGSATSVYSAASGRIVGEEPGLADRATSALHDAVYGTEKPMLSKASMSAQSMAQGVAESASSVIHRSEPNLQGKASSMASAGVAGASKVLYGTETSFSEKLAATASSAASKVFSHAQDAVSQAHEQADYLGSQAPAAASTVSSMASIVSDKASNVIIGEEPPMAERMSSRVSEAVYGSEPNIAEQAISSASSLASTASERIMGTEPAMAERVSQRAREAVFGRERGNIEKATSVMKASAAVVEEKVASATASAASSVSRAMPVAAKNAESLSSSLASVARKASDAAKSMAGDVRAEL